MKKKVFLVLVVFLVNISLANALLVSPPDMDIGYTPNYNQTIILNVGGHKADDPIKIKLYPKGDLNKSLFLSENSATLNRGEWKQFSGSMVLPPDLKPGMHINSIIIKEDKGDEETGIGAIVAIDFRLNVLVPYPGKYIETSIEVTNIEVGETAYFKVHLMSKGNEDIPNIKGSIEIYDQENKIDALNFEKALLKSTEDIIITVPWDSAGNSAGLYKAKAIVSYDNAKSEAETDFRIGELSIEIVDITGTVLEQDRINKIDIIAVSKWNGYIDDVYAEIYIYDKDTKIKTAKSETIKFDPWDTKTLSVYIDTKDMEVKEYPAKAILHYSDKTTEKEFKIIVKKGLKSLFTTQTILIIVIIVLIALAIINLKRLRKIKRR